MILKEPVDEWMVWDYNKTIDTIKASYLATHEHREQKEVKD